MTIDTEPRVRPLPELEAEQEVDFGRYLGAVATRWWLLVVGIVAGAIIGYLASLGGSTQYKGTAQVYLGNPLAPGAGGQVSSVPTALGLVTNLVKSEATVRAVAARVGLKPSRLRGHVSTRPIQGITGGRIGTPAPLLEIAVTGAPAGKVAAAANALARVAARATSGYPDVKIQQLKERLAFDQRELTRVRENLALVQRQLRTVLADKTLGSAERLIAQSSLNSLLIFNQQRQANIEQDQFAVRQLLKLAEDVERGRVVQEAVAVQTAGPSRRTGVLVGAFIGLIAGIVAALLWEPVAVRIRRPV